MLTPITGPVEIVEKTSGYQEFYDKCKAEADRAAAFGGGEGVTEHSLLTGLEEDDHTQYYNETRGDARYRQSSVDIDIGDIDATGTPDSTTYLRGDGSWSTPSSGSAAVYDAIVLTNTDDTTDLNQNTWTLVPIGGTVARAGTDFTVVSTNTIRCDFTGTIKVTAQVFVTTVSTNRLGIGCRIAKNATKLGPVSVCYVRGTDNLFEGSVGVSFILDVVTNDVISVEAIREGATGSLTQVTGQSALMVERFV